VREERGKRGIKRGTEEGGKKEFGGEKFSIEFTEDKKSLFLKGWGERILTTYRGQKIRGNRLNL